MGGMEGGYGGSAGGMGGTRGPIMKGGTAGGEGGMGGYGSGSMGYGSGSGYGGMSGYGGVGEGMSGMTLTPPKFKLVRFTDTHVEAGKYYRYRVAVQVHDPNHPALSFTPPTLASLADDVRTRVRALDTDDAKNPRAGFRTFWRVSEWSQPSEVITLPSLSLFFAGSVDQPGSQVPVEGKPKVPNGQPSVKVLTSAWDPVKVADVPAEEQAYRGSILNFVKDAKVIHPVNHDVVDMKEYKFQTNALVADLMGGESIPKRDKGKSSDPLTAPGELLVFDADGNLRVQNETDDIEAFRRLLVPEPKAPATPGGAEGGYAPTGMPGEGGYGGYPEASGGRRSRGSARGSGSGSGMP
jgi:hypothetical protein